MRTPLALTTLLLLLAAPRARAHDADLLALTVERGEGGVLEERLTLTAATLLALAPLDTDGDGALTAAELAARPDSLEAGVWDGMPLTAGGVACAREGSEAALREGYVELAARFRCPPGPLVQRFELLSLLPAQYRLVLGGGAGDPQRFADATAPTLALDPPGATTAAAPVRGLGGWVRLGVTHILEGWDHLAFLLALLLVGGRLRQVLGMVTAFTLAHSLTLGATALGWVVLDARAARFVEAAIALSIVWVAVENLVLREHRHRAVLTFLFGLVHGFGFASVLAHYGLGERVAVGLLGFNLGVELGQGAVVLALLPLLRLARRRPRLFPWVQRGVSCALVALGGYWLVERVWLG